MAVQFFSLHGLRIWSLTLLTTQPLRPPTVLVPYETKAISEDPFVIPAVSKLGKDEAQCSKGCFQDSLSTYVVCVYAERDVMKITRLKDRTKVLS